MKTKTINAVISKKINNWLDSIEDKELVKKITPNIIVTGGAITSMLLNEPVNDFDIYFKTKDSLKAICQYYTEIFNQNNANRQNKLGRPLHAWVLDGEDVEKWQNGNIELSSFAYDYPDISYADVINWEEGDENKKSHSRISGMILNTPKDRLKVMVNSDGIAEDSDEIADKSEYSIDTYLDALGDGDEISSEAAETTKYKPVFLSTNAITLSGKIQIVVRFYGDVGEIHKNYDFVHATNYWTYDTGAVLNLRALESILNKELFYVGSKYPVCSLVRIRKFIKRGWQINAGQFVKIAFQISELDLSNIYVLEDQLVGVDSIYFLNFIKSIKHKKSEDKNFRLTQEYLTTVIDRIFG